MGIKPPYARRGIDYFTKNKVFPIDGSVTIEGFKANIDIQFSDGILKEPLPPPERYADQSYVQPGAERTRVVRIVQAVNGTSQRPRATWGRIRLTRKGVLCYPIGNSNFRAQRESSTNMNHHRVLTVFLLLGTNAFLSQSRSSAQVKNRHRLRLDEFGGDHALGGAGERLLCQKRP